MIEVFLMLLDGRRMEMRIKIGRFSFCDILMQLFKKLFESGRFIKHLGCRILRLPDIIPNVGIKIR